MLYQEPIRSLLLWIANEGAYRPFWTEKILAETRDSLLRRGVIALSDWERLQTAMLAAFPDAELDQRSADELEPRMPNDLKDRHVLAAAVMGGIDLIVTNNLRHFDSGDLAKVGRRSLNADGFLCELIDRSPRLVYGALNLQVAHMRNPRPWELAELVGRLGGRGETVPLTPAFAEEVESRFAIKPLPPPST